MPQTQTYQNHARFFPPYHFFVAPVLLINFLYSIWQLYVVPSGSTAWGVVFAAAIVMLGLTVRLMVLTVQNRLIRLEMRLRLKEVLPWDLRNRINELTVEQLIALRFASDDEMPALVREILAGNLRSQKEIKGQVKNWQPDHIRA